MKETAVRTISTGQPSTLGTYLDLCNVLFGEESKQTKFIASKIKEQGHDQEVIAEESQMMYLLVSMGR